jgi:hypothetical protein
MLQPAREPAAALERAGRPHRQRERLARSGVAALPPGPLLPAAAPKAQRPGAVVPV